MGNQSTQQKNQPKIDKMKFEISVIKIKAYLELQRDRRKNEVMNKEKMLIQCCSQAVRNKLDEVHKASSIVSDIQYIEACDIVIRYCDILKDRSFHIVNSQGNPQQIEELMPCIESVIWATKPLNLNCLQEFSSMMLYFFGAQQINVDQSQKVDQDLKKCFQNVMPSKYEINAYFYKFAQTSGLGLQVINNAGHNIVEPSLFVIEQPPVNPGFQGQHGNGMNPVVNQYQGNMPVYPGVQQPINVQVFIPNQQGFQQQQPIINNPPIYQQFPIQQPIIQQPFMQQQQPQINMYQQQMQPNFNNPNSFPSPNLGEIDVPPQNVKQFQMPPSSQPPQQFGGQFQQQPIQPAVGGYLIAPSNQQNQLPVQQPQQNIPQQGPSQDSLEERLKRLKGGLD